MAEGITYHSILGVKRTASQDEIKRAYRRLIMICHPDKTGGEQHLYDVVTRAYEALSNPDSGQAQEENTSDAGYRRHDSHESNGRLRCKKCDGYGYNKFLGSGWSCLQCEGKGWVPGRKF